MNAYIKSTIDCWRMNIALAHEIRVTNELGLRELLVLVTSKIMNLVKQIGFPYSLYLGLSCIISFFLYFFGSWYPPLLDMRR